MNWLTPNLALIAGAIVIPLLVLMYFLKLKRREQMISSTFLWKRAVQDLQVNAPFQKLRRNILLLLQLLAIIAILIALAGPILSMSAGPAKRHVLLIDNSASMNVVEKGRTRLSLAKEQAKNLIESLRSQSGFSLQDSSDQAMVVTFGSSAKVLCNFTSDKQQLLAAVNFISPTDSTTQLAEAITISRAFAQSTNREQPQTGRPTAQLELFSDGIIEDLEQIIIAEDEMSFHCIGEGDSNIAVVSMQARRSYEKADEVTVFATLANFSPEEVSCDVQLSVDDNIRAVRSVKIPARKSSPTAEGKPTPGSVSISYNLTHARSGVFEVRLLHSDMLACDDAAWAIVPPARKLSVLVVTAGNVSLVSALRACPLARLDVKTLAQFQAMNPDILTVDKPYDVIVLDNCVPANLPRGRYLVLGQPPKNIGAEIVGDLKNQTVVDWRSRHPALQFVDMTNLFVAKCPKLSLARDAEVLAEFSGSPAIAIIRRQGSTFLLVGFDPMQSNWPFEPSFVMFCYNAMNYLGMEAGQGRDTAIKVGMPISQEGLPPDAEVIVTGPGVKDAKIVADASGVARFPATDLAGIYTLSDAGPASHFAVNLLSAVESDIKPAKKIELAGRKIETQKDPVHLTNVKLWPVLVMVVLFLVCVEWLVYTSKVKL